MSYNYWLDFMEDMRKEGELIIALYLEIMEEYKAEKFWILGKDDKLEVIKPNE